MPVPARLDVVAAPVVNHAMAHNGIRVLHRVTVSLPPEPAAASLRDLRLSARLVDDQGHPLTLPWSHQIDQLDSGDQVVLDDPPLRLDAAAMAGLTEATQGDLSVTLTGAGEPVVRVHAAVRVLAARQWLVDPDAPLLSLELLAAFVQPNHPALGPLVGRAAALLERETGSGSLAVTHVSPGRVDAIVEALCGAIVDAGIFYAEPPASWGYGQQVRTPGDVLEHHVGTCLDTTVLLASALEHVGIHPVLWLARGHAFAGYWRTDSAALPDAASLVVADAVNAVGLGYLGLVETTLLTRERRPPRDLFRRAGQAPRDAYIDTDQSALVGVVDVAMARLMRVYPVPARTVRPDGSVEIVTYQPAEPSTGMPLAGPPGVDAGAAPSAAGAPAPARRTRPDPPPRVQAWKNALLDLTLRNPLLNLGRGVTNLPLVLPGEHLGVLADMLAQERPIAVRAVDDLPGALLGREVRSAHGLPVDVLRSMLRERGTAYTAADSATHERLIARLRYRARTGTEETGANPLALTLGRLDWRLGERDLSAPLVLAPVLLKGLIRPFKIVADDAGEPTLNLSLLEKLRLEFGLVVPGLDELPRRPEPVGAVDIDEVVRRVRQAVADAGLSFTVTTEARLAIVGFTGYLLWRDLDEHWETFLQAPVARHVALTPTERFVPPDEPGATPTDLPLDLSVAALDEVTAAVPIPADGAQAEAIAAARAGRTFVLEGPPGTGKSQTITNIIADQIASGRRVLFVAEKGAALDVVRRRLDEVGLTPYVLDLHDEHARPAQVRERLRAALAATPRPDDDGFRVAAADLAASAATLGGYAARLHSPGPVGVSAYGAHAQLLALGHGATVPVWHLPQDAAGIVASARAAVLAATAELAALTPDAVATWGFARSRPADLDRLTALVARADAAVQDLSARIEGCPEPVRRALLGAGDPRSLEVAGWLLSEGATRVEVLDEMDSARWREARLELGNRLDRLRAAAQPVLTVLSPEAVALDLDATRLQVREAATSFFLGRKGRILRAASPVLRLLLPGAGMPPKAVPALVEQLAGLAQDARGLVAAWRSLPGVTTLPAHTNLLDPAGAAALADILAGLDRDAGLARSSPIFHGGTDWKRAARAGVGVVLDDVNRATQAAASALVAVFAEVGRPHDPLGRDIVEWARLARGLLPAWTEGARARRADLPVGSALRRWCAAVTALDPLDEHFFPARWELLRGAIAPHEALTAWDRGVATAAFDERAAEGGLAGFDPAAHDLVVERFVGAAAQLRESLHGILPARVVAQRPFAHGALFGRVAALEREVSRTRGGLSVRRLVQTYGEVIGEVTPCLLVSPDSLARFVPPGSIAVDLVVFDEASQITVPDAIGALGRARAAVIAGDSKQLPPTSFGQAAEPDDGQDVRDDDADPAAEDFLLVRDEESILSEMVHAGVDRRWLTWHYRSQDESLIAFSNAAYYEDRLSSFPSAPGEDTDRGVTFTRVNGTFLRSAGPEGPLRTNPVEAAAVVSEVRRRWSAGERSLGVVTFNAQQRTLIETMLWESGDEAIQASLATGGGGLFVKNLENVQGDERDVVIFSTGFSAARNGTLPLNFGPLNRAGGERRLNVAITRARRRVLVFCSFEPEDLRVEATTSVGIHHLRAYLELAKHGPRNDGPRFDGSMSAPGPGPTPPPGAEARPREADGPLRVREIRVDRHREQIADRLRSAGLEVATAVGMSDFKVDLGVGLGGGRPLCLAVLLDSPEWAARRTTTDRDALPTTVLHDLLGWPGVLRIWLPAWLADADAVVEQVRRAVTVASIAPRRRNEQVRVTGYAGSQTPEDGPPPTEPQDEAPAEVRDVLAEEPRDLVETEQPRQASRAPTTPTPPGPAGALTYRPFTPRIVGTTRVLDRLTRDPDAAGRVQEVIRAIVAAEGPVAQSRVVELTARSFGLTRAPVWRVAELTTVLPPDLRRDPEEGFLWPDAMHPLTWTGFRTWEASLRERPLETIALREIANAHAALARSAMGITEEELLRQTLRLFNGTRLTEAPRTRLTAALQLAARRELLDIAGGIVMPRHRA